MKNLKSICQIAAAIFFFSLSFNLFQQPNGMVTGGVTGIVLVLHQLFQLPIPFTTFCINSLFLTLGLIVLGKNFFFKTILGSLVFYPFFLKVIPTVQVSDDMIINAVLGGVVMGIGMTFLYFSKGSSGGTSVLARLLNKYTKIPFTLGVFLFDGTIILSGFIVFGIDKGVYAIILSLISMRIANYFETNLGILKQVCVISEKSDQIENVLNELNTSLSYKVNDQTLVYVVTKRELSTISKQIDRIDQEAVLIASDATVA